MMKPDNELALAEAVAGATSPLRIQGGGTRPIGRVHDTAQGDVLSTAGLSGIKLYEPGALTMVAQAGTPVAEIEAALAQENQRLPFEPMDHRALLRTKGEPTIGGVVATNASGPRRIQAGACRDSLIGVRYVDGQGVVIKNGGRVMKNVTGYDLVKLMAGSYGTLGVLSEVSFKVLPGIEATATLVYSGLGWTDTSAVFAEAMGSPYEVSAAGRLPAGLLGAEGALVLRLEGFSDSVTYRTKALADLITKSICTPSEIITDQEKTAEIWTNLRNVTPFAGRDGDIWRISVKPSDLANAAGAAGLGHEDVVVDWAGGLIWACVPDGVDLRAKLAGIGGHATLIRATEASKAALGTFQPEPPALAALSQGLRAQFDPRGIFNTGLMG